MKTTRPPGGKTGRTTEGCYAAPLLDCDGGPLTNEHYLSEALLRKFPKTFMASGLHWLAEPRNIPPQALQAKMLCKRHNNALSPLDTTVACLFEVLARAEQGYSVGAHEFDGESLERWAIKVLLGLVASGNLFGAEGKATVVPHLYLRVLFGEESVSQGCGFYYIGDPVKGFDADLLNVAVNRYPPADAEEGSIFGITIQLVWLRFLTTVTARIDAEQLGLVHRPGGLQLGVPERGRIGLRWDPPSTTGLIVKMPER